MEILCVKILIVSDKYNFWIDLFWTTPFWPALAGQLWYHLLSLME